MINKTKINILQLKIEWTIIMMKFFNSLGSMKILTEKQTSEVFKKYALISIGYLQELKTLKFGV